MSLLRQGYYKNGGQLMRQTRKAGMLEKKAAGRRAEMLRRRRMFAPFSLFSFLIWSCRSSAFSCQINSTPSPDCSSGVETQAEDRLEEKVTSEDSFSIQRLFSPDNDIDCRLPQEFKHYSSGFNLFFEGAPQSNDEVQASLMTSSWNSDKAESSCTSDTVKITNYPKPSENVFDYGSCIQNECLDQEKDLLDQLIDLYRKRNGELPTDDIVYGWCETFKSAIAKQCSIAANQSESRFLHVSGIYVDFDKSAVYSTHAKRKAPRLLPQCQHMYPDGSRCGLISSFVQFPHREDREVAKVMVCRLHSSEMAESTACPETEGKKFRSPDKHVRVSKMSPKSLRSIHCISPECGRTASYGDISMIDPSMHRALYCKRHKLPHHQNLRHLKCQYEGGCMKQAVCGNPIDRVRLRCSKHARSGDINLAERRFLPSLAYVY
eukprot:756732-Hanusia_phi.AAC.14